jgi:hypothetical protein
MSDECKKPGVVFWATVVVVVVPLLYVLSFGPACWWFPREVPSFHGNWFVARQIYRPFGWLRVNGPAPIAKAVAWCATLGREDIALPTGMAGNETVPALWTDE